MEQNAERIPLWKKIVFGTGDVYAGGAQQLVGFIYMYFLTDVVGLRPSLAGFVYFLSKIWDAISDPMFGVLSDRTKTRFGRRRPYFLAGTVLILLSFTSLWLPFRFGTQGGMFIFALLAWLFHETVCSMVLVPFYALSGDLTADYHERNSLMFARLFISTLTIILVAVLPPIFVRQFADPRLGYAVMGACFGFLFALPWFAIFFAFPERDGQADPDLTFVAQIIEPLRIKSFRQLMLLFISGYTAVDLMSGVFVYYMTYYLQRTDFHLVLGALLIGQAALLPLWLVLAKPMGKRNALIAGYAWWTLMIAAMAAVTPSWPKPAIYVIAFLMGGGSGAAAFLPWAIFPDVADVSELTYGARRDGASGGFLTFARKCSTALAMGLFGIALDLAGFVKPVMDVPQPQPHSALLVIRGALFLAPALLMGLGIFVAAGFGITAPVQAKIRRYLAYRRGETADGDLPHDEVVYLKRLLAGRKHAACAAVTPPAEAAKEPGFLASLAALAKAGIFLILVPRGLIRLARLLSPWLPVFNPGTAGRIAGLALAAAGAYLALRAGLILAWAGKEWPRRRPILLVTRYIYSFARHPMYIGYTAALAGYFLHLGSTAGLLLSLGIGALLLLYARCIEEPALIKRFGDRYLDYRCRVGFLRPQWRALGRGALSMSLGLLLVAALFRLVFRVLWRVKAEGLENLPWEGPYLLAANHTNLADPFLLGVFLVRPIRFIASDELFRRPILRLLFGLFFGALKKRRWSRDVAVLRQAERWLNRGEVVGIFPEGSRTWDGGPVRVGDEVYRFLHHCRVPVVAACVVGGHEAMPRWSGWPAGARITIRLSPPIRPEECPSYHHLRHRIEGFIFQGQTLPPVERTFWASHKGITTVAWACLKCGANRSMTETTDGVACRRCGSSWRVTRRLELVDEATGEVLLERDYHDRLKEKLAAGELEGGGAIRTEVKAYRLNQLELVPLGPGELSLDGKTLTFANGRHLITARIDEVAFAFLNLHGHLVVSDKKGTLEFVFRGDSPVRWEDHIALARRDFASRRAKPDKAGAVEGS